MKVLAIMVDVTNLTPAEIDDLQSAMEAQCEEAGGTDNGNASRVDMFDAPILSSKVKDIDLEFQEEKH